MEHWRRPTERRTNDSKKLETNALQSSEKLASRICVLDRLSMGME